MKFHLLMYLDGPYYTGPNYVHSKPTLTTGSYFSNVHGPTLIDKHNTRLFNAISRKITPFRAGVIRANKVYVPGKILILHKGLIN